jgi:hypothetical protein
VQRTTDQAKNALRADIFVGSVNLFKIFKALEAFRAKPAYAASQ